MCGSAVSTKGNADNGDQLQGDRLILLGVIQVLYSFWGLREEVGLSRMGKDH